MDFYRRNIRKVLQTIRLDEAFVMMTHMSSTSHENEILNPVISADSIDVMNNLSFKI
jgi:hypothetical protein